jgi:hypothetical protein
MLRSPRVWLYAAGGWLIVVGLAHTALHVWGFVLEHGMVGLREFAMNAMKQAQSLEPLRPSLWRQFRAFSLSFSLLLFFAGMLDVAAAAMRLHASILRRLALFGTVFWTAAFVPFAFLDPIAQALVAVIVAVPLHAIAYLTASLEEAEIQGAPTTPRG